MIKYFVLSTSSPQVTASCERGRSTVITLRCNPEKGERGELTVPRCVFLLSCMFKAITVNILNAFPPVCVFSKCPAGTCDGCTFYFLWESSSACPICTEADYHSIEGVCKGGMQVKSLVSSFTGFFLFKFNSSLKILISICLVCMCIRTSCTCGTSLSCVQRACHSLIKAPPPVRQSHCG